jgi:predicted acyl esterase
VRSCLLLKLPRIRANLLRSLAARAQAYRVPSFTSEVLAGPVKVTGHLSLTMFASSSAPDTDFTGELVDVFPDARVLHGPGYPSRLILPSSAAEPAGTTEPVTPRAPARPAGTGGRSGPHAASAGRAVR